MSFGKQKSSQHLNPGIMNTLAGNVSRVQSMADAPYQPYTGQRVAGFNPV